MSGHLRLLRPTDAPSGWARRTDGGLTPWLVIESVERAPEIGYLMGRGVLIWQLRKASLRLRIDTDTRGVSSAVRTGFPSATATGCRSRLTPVRSMRRSSCGCEISTSTDCRWRHERAPCRARGSRARAPHR
jgi:hypothetical protein